MDENPILAHYRERAHRWPIQGYIDSLSEGNRWQWERVATEAEMDEALAQLRREAGTDG